MAATVLVVIPVRNRPRLVREALESVRAQTRAPDEVVVVDDGSTDGATPEAVETWIAQREPPFPARLLRREHRGISAARNAGLAAGRHTRWAAFLDSDDLWPPDFLARCLAAAARDADAVVVTADQRLEDGATGEVRHQEASSLEARPLDWLLSNEPCLCSASLLRADRLRARGGFDESLLTGEDVDVLLPLAAEGPWLHAPGAPVVYRRGTADAGDVNNSRRFDDRFRRWARIYDAWLARPGLRKAVDPGLRRARLWWYWFEAGEELFHKHRRREARPCFARALRYDPLDRKTWSRWSKCVLRPR